MIKKTAPLKEKTAPLKGYPFSGEPRDPDPVETIRLLTVATAKSDAIHQLTMDAWFDYALLIEVAKNRNLANRLEHSARILENVAYQLMELTAAAKKEMLNEDNS